MPAMLALSNPTDKTIRTQIAEAVSLIAELDFPNKWPDLLDVSHMLFLKRHHELITSLAIGCVLISY